MSAIVYRICTLLEKILTGVPIGTNRGLLQLLFALVAGRFLPARGAVFAALTELGLPRQDVCRTNAALCYGRWQTKTLLDNWHKTVLAEGAFRAHSYEGFRPVACDTTGFFRPQLQGHAGKHYTDKAAKALPAVVVGIAAAVGTIGDKRFALPRLLVRWEAGDTSEDEVERRLIRQAAQTLAPDEALVYDAGAALAAMLDAQVGFVVRLPKNATARRNALPDYKGKGRRPDYGQRVRPLPRERAKNKIPATPPDATFRWKHAGRTLRAQVWKALVLPDALPGSASFWIVAILDPRYPQPLLLATNLSVSARAVWQLYRDRWAVEHLPLAAKPMLGAERAFVFGKESRLRLPELALLAGSLLSYVAAQSAPMASGFWDRAARPTCGRLRRALCRVHFSELPVLSGQLRKKNAVTAHLPKGILAHRRTKQPETVLARLKAA